MLKMPKWHDYNILSCFKYSLNIDIAIVNILGWMHNELHTLVYNNYKQIIGNMGILCGFLDR